MLCLGKPHADWDFQCDERKGLIFSSGRVPLDLGALELLTEIELLLVEIFCIFPIQHSFQAAVIVEEKGLMRDVLAFTNPARVGSSDRRLASGTRPLSHSTGPNRQRFH
jgi:hypothetical protein